MRGIVKVRGIEGVGKDDDEGAAVELLGKKVEGRCKVRGQR